MRDLSWLFGSFQADVLYIYKLSSCPPPAAPKCTRVIVGLRMERDNSGVVLKLVCVRFEFYATDPECGGHKISQMTFRRDRAG